MPVTTGYALFTPFSTSTPTRPPLTSGRRTTTARPTSSAPALTSARSAAESRRRPFTDGTDYTLHYRIERISRDRHRVERRSDRWRPLETRTPTRSQRRASRPTTTFDYFGWRVGSLNFAAAITFKAVAVDLSLVPPAIATQPFKPRASLKAPRSRLCPRPWAALRSCCGGQGTVSPLLAPTRPC